MHKVWKGHRRRPFEVKQKEFDTNFCRSYHGNSGFPCWSYARVENILRDVLGRSKVWCSHSVRFTRTVYLFALRVRLLPGRLIIDLQPPFQSRKCVMAGVSLFCRPVLGGFGAPSTWTWGLLYSGKKKLRLVSFLYISAWSAASRRIPRMSGWIREDCRMRKEINCRRRARLSKFCRRRGKYVELRRFP